MIEWAVVKDTKTVRSTAAGKSVTQPIGGKKAAKFTMVEGPKLIPASHVLSQKASAKGLKGDAYRAEIAKAFKKGLSVVRYHDGGADKSHRYD